MILNFYDVLSSCSGWLHVCCSFSSRKVTGKYLVGFNRNLFLISDPPKPNAPIYLWGMNDAGRRAPLARSPDLNLGQRPYAHGRLSTQFQFVMYNQSLYLFGHRLDVVALTCLLLQLSPWKWRQIDNLKLQTPTRLHLNLINAINGPNTFDWRYFSSEKK